MLRPGGARPAAGAADPTSSTPCRGCDAPSCTAWCGHPGRLRDPDELSIVEYSLQDALLHSPIESSDAEWFERGMRSVAIRRGLGLHREIGRHGALFRDRR
jgi:hypothetical protein